MHTAADYREAILRVKAAEEAVVEGYNDEDKYQGLMMEFSAAKQALYKLVEA